MHRKLLTMHELKSCKGSRVGARSCSGGCVSRKNTVARFFFYFFGSPATAARRVLKISRDTEWGYRYISLFGRCLRLVSYAVRTLPRLWLRAFRPRSSLPSLYYRTAGNSVAAHETTAANDSAGRGGVKRSRLLAILPLTKRREEGIRLRPVSKQ
jgi:hypothetical protein